ncbi:arginine decarboxylase [Rhodanobacter denitrificans]|uniref:arginine decarboxylase n=1 Tax=Rhodanobacter denitrificans TaxID=666685 RepID=UPI001F4796C8|nr:arginine decarboxylase [Rhodanobacter denitrificans]UJJ60227.1 arginine decarboxylase [Rhodanobacter denitrificans]
MSRWTTKRANQTYAIPHWSNGYVDVARSGHLLILPRRDKGAALDLPTIVNQATSEGLRLPLLVRFPDILADRLDHLRRAFAGAIEHANYPGSYIAVYPIKVNQQKSVVSKLVAAGEEGFGLEAGSKPELMAVLACARPGSVVVCNGYKDREYIRLALTGRKLGLRVHIVIEKLTELDHIFREAKSLDVEPLLGVRVRLASIGAGKWQNSGGSKSKFGLSSGQVLELVERLDAANLKHTLRLQHFHMGSQISNVHDIAAGMREAARYFVDLHQLGVPIDIVDVGGGLGVDYDGTRSRSFNSISYSLDEYAAAIVQPLAKAVAEHGLTAPVLCTESGRAMTAHHAVMVVNVSEVERASDGGIPDARPDEPATLRSMRELLAESDARPAREIIHDANRLLSTGQDLYALGKIDLHERARLDELFHAIAKAVRMRPRPDGRALREAENDLYETLVDKYFVNFSVFESVPDVWAIDQVFPIVPISRLDEEPTRRGVIVDLTCDSDGRIDHYVNAQGVDVNLPLHAMEDDRPYRLGIFMVGAYQETLGDIHNLFGDTDAVDVHVTANGYAFTHIRRGDTTDVMLDYVGYDPKQLREQYADRLAAAGTRGSEAKTFLEILDKGLTGYTYLAETMVPEATGIPSTQPCTAARPSVLVD